MSGCMVLLFPLDVRMYGDTVISVSQTTYDFIGILGPDAYEIVCGLTH